MILNIQFFRAKITYLKNIKGDIGFKSNFQTCKFWDARAKVSKIKVQPILHIRILSKSA